jgi:hypothetical protein
MDARVKPAYDEFLAICSALKKKRLRSHRPLTRIQEVCNRLTFPGEYSTGTSKRSSIWPTIRPCSACVTRLISGHSVSAMKADHAAVLVVSSGHSRR